MLSKLLQLPVVQWFETYHDQEPSHYVSTASYRHPKYTQNVKTRVKNIEVE